MSKGGGGGGSTTTVQKADPWAGLQPGLVRLYNAASANFDRGGPEYYPLDTFAGTNGNIEQSLNMGQQRATAGSPNVRSAQQQNLSTINGSYLSNANPHLGAMYNAASRGLTDNFMNAIAPSIGSQFSMAGRMGSNSHAAAIGQAAGALSHGLGDMGANLYGNAYDSERNRQQQAIGMAPQLANADYTDLDKLMGIGQFQQAQQQQGIDANRARYDFYQNKPFNNLMGLNQILQGGMSLNGSTSQNNQSMNRNPFAGAIGGAAALSGLGGAMGGEMGGVLGGPLGMLGGALLGGLFG